eukprot:COSAG02_NODE_714_length_18094_cov_13.275688_10_plen_304_part_00
MPWYATDGQVRFIARRQDHMQAAIAVKVPRGGRRSAHAFAALMVGLSAGVGRAEAGLCRAGDPCCFGYEPGCRPPPPLPPPSPPAPTGDGPASCPSCATFEDFESCKSRAVRDCGAFFTQWESGNGLICTQSCADALLPLRDECSDFLADAPGLEPEIDTIQAAAAMCPPSCKSYQRASACMLLQRRWDGNNNIVSFRCIVLLSAEFMDLLQPMKYNCCVRDSCNEGYPTACSLESGSEWNQQSEECWRALEPLATVRVAVPSICARCDNYVQQNHHVFRCVVATTHIHFNTSDTCFRLAVIF